MRWRRAKNNKTDINEIYSVFQFTPGYDHFTKEEIEGQLRCDPQNGTYTYIYNTRNKRKGIVITYRFQEHNIFNTPEWQQWAIKNTTWRRSRIIVNEKIKIEAKKLGRYKWKTVNFPRTTKGTKLHISITDRYTEGEKMEILDKFIDDKSDPKCDFVYAVLKIPRN